MTILVTGAAGFIGSHVCLALLESGNTVVGIDSLNTYYDVTLKQARLNRLSPYKQFQFIKLDLADQAGMNHLFQEHRFSRVINLAAQAGVRYSLENPHAYVDSNLTGFVNILEGCRHHQVPHLVFASTSSVYGANTAQPFKESDHTDHPMSLYAASKKANEVMAHAYASLYQLPCTGLRFFNVYGPWGRPDMALFKFTKNILAGIPIDVYNKGNMIRDFTYVDDIVAGIIKAMNHIAKPNPAWNGDHPDAGSSYAPYRIYNIGNNQPVQLLEYIRAIESAVGKKALMNMLPIQPGDVPSTFADVSRLEQDFAYKPTMNVQEGVRRFVAWYLKYYQVKL